MVEMDSNVPQPEGQSYLYVFTNLCFYKHPAAVLIGLYSVAVFFQASKNKTSFLSLVV
jgi:hypothetical protein